MDDPPSEEANEPAEKPDSAQGPRSRRFRIPTPVVVTLVGIALTAWLLPAITRQWDDRQKERELKAAVVRDIASATAQALVGGEAIWSKQPLTPQQRMRLGDHWSESHLEIEAQLRTYFSKEIVASWQVYAWAVDRFINARRVSAFVGLQEVAGSQVDLDGRVAEEMALFLVYGMHASPPAPNFVMQSFSETLSLRHLEYLLRADMHRWEDSLGIPKRPTKTIADWRSMEKALLRLERAVAAQVVAAHAQGYSTTSADLLRDLVP